MNDYYGKALTATEVCGQGLVNNKESLEEDLKFQRQMVAKRLAAIDEALTQLHNHPEVQDVLEALKKVQSY